MIIDRNGASSPCGTVVFKIADEFFLFGVNTDDGIASASEAFAHSGDMFKLTVAQCTVFCSAFAGSCYLFVIYSHGIAQIPQKRRHRVGTHRYVQLAQLHCDVLRCLASPFQSGHWVASGFIFHQLMDPLDDFRRFF